MDAMQQLYQQLILEHSKHPHGRVPAEANLLDPIGTSSPEGDNPTPKVGTSRQFNPTCGDEIELAAAVDDAGNITELVWQGQGCSISQAAASVMAESLTGESLETAQTQNELFHRLMQSRGKGLPESEAEELGDAVAFTGVSQYPARIKCALLGWEALKDALAKATIL
jgi:nitrogen fixation NifU-like protein